MVSPNAGRQLLRIAVVDDSGKALAARVARSFTNEVGRVVRRIDGDIRRQVETENKRADSRFAACVDVGNIVDEEVAVGYLQRHAFVPQAQQMRTTTYQ